MTLDKEALEAAARALSGEGHPLGYFPSGRPMRDATFEDYGPREQQEYRDEAARAITTYLSAMAEKGFRMMPREATDRMAIYGAISEDRMTVHMGGISSARQKRAREVWRAMFDGAPQDAAS